MEFNENSSPDDVNDYSEGEVIADSPVKLTQAEIEALYAVPNKNKNNSSAPAEERLYSVSCSL